MIDPKVFAELQNRGIITVVGLESTQFENLDELKNLGLATSIATEAEYKAAIEKFINVQAAAEKFLADIAAGGEVIVPCDLIFEKFINVSKDVTLNLNGHTLEIRNTDLANGAGFGVAGSACLTIEGDGKLISNSRPVWIYGANASAVINGGKFVGSDHPDAKCEVFYINGKNSTLTINGGEFVATHQSEGLGAPDYTIINIMDSVNKTAKVEVKGGKFYKFDPANNISEGANTNFVVTGYTSIANGDWFEVVEGVDNEDSLKASVALGGSTKLLKNITLTDYINVKTDVTIDLNGYSIVHPIGSTSKYPDAFEVMTGGKLTLNGKGSVVAENGYAVYAAGDAVVTINGGEYFSPVSVVDARKNASVTINDGVFKVDGTNNAEGDFGQKYTLNLRDKVGNYTAELSEIVVKGGKFYKYNPAASESEPTVTNFVAKGYESVAEGDWYVVREAKDIVVEDNE